MEEKKTLRDEFAMAAMAQHVANAYNHPDTFLRLAKSKGISLNEYVSNISYEMADAMLNQRTKQ